MPKALHGINPVTLRDDAIINASSIDGRSELQLTLGRLHVGVATKMIKFFHVAMFDPHTHEVIAHVAVHEDQLLTALCHLYPDGSLDHLEHSSPPMHQFAIQLLRRALFEVDSPLASDIQQFLEQYGVE